MTKLVPVRRMNKNGVWSTKYVRADSSKVHADQNLPSPSLATDDQTLPPLVAAYPRQKRTRTFSQYDFLFKPEPALQEYLERDGLTGKVNGDYYWDSTELESLEVISTVSPDNAIPLLAHGVRSAQQAREVLSESGLTHLIEDNSIVVNTALLTGASLDELLDKFSNRRSMFGDSPMMFADGVTASQERWLERRVPGSGDVTLRQMIDDDLIDLEHVKFIGVERFISALDTDGLLLSEMQLMHLGTASYSHEDVDEWIDKFYLVDKQSQSHTKHVIYTLGNRHGSDYVSGLQNEIVSLFGTYEFSRLGTEWGYTPGRELEFISFGGSAKAAIYNSGVEGVSFSDDEYKLLFESGVAPDKITDGLKSGLTPAQIVAVKKHGIQPSISDGWI